MIHSSEAYRHLPGKMSLCGQAMGWRSMLLRAYREPEEAEFVTAPTADHLIVLVRRGGCAMESFSRGEWRTATYRVGDVGMAAPGQASRLRWRGSRSHDTLQLHLPAGVVEEVTREVCTQRGAAVHLPNPLSARDPVVSATLRSLESALTGGASDVYAEAAAYFLAAHLLAQPSATATQPKPRQHSVQLDRVDGYMRSRLAEPVSLAELAASIDVSVFQLIRMCRTRWGETPLARLTRLRMDKASELLESTNDSVTTVAFDSGYASPSHFATAFRRHLGMPPSRYRALRRSA